LLLLYKTCCVCGQLKKVDEAINSYLDAKELESRVKQQAVV